MALVQYALPADMDYDKIFQAPDTYDVNIIRSIKH